MTRNEILGEIFQRWCYCHEEYIKPAYEELCKTDALARRKVWHSTAVNSDLFFTNIDSAIYYLQTLKEEGYTCIEEKYNRGVYEVVVSKYEEETDDEYYSRLIDTLHRTIEQQIEIETQSNAKAARIAKLKAEIKRLESE